MPLRTNPYKTVVKEFEKVVALYAGAPYAVAVDTCTDAIFLSLKYRTLNEYYSPYVMLPTHTYCSVPNAVIHAGLKIVWDKNTWFGAYDLRPFKIIDSALRFNRGMYEAGMLYCLSFQYRKHIPIGRGGMILTDNIQARDWLRLARFNGREEVPLAGDVEGPKMIGWLMHMEPERAARGLNFMMHAKDRYPDLHNEYPDLSKMPVYDQHTKPTFS